MSYDITLLKPAAALLDDNRVWVSHLCRAFAELDDAGFDVQANADLAEDVGMTEQEWVSRGIGVRLCRRGQPDIVEIAFWESTAEISLPNFPRCEPAELLAAVARYIDTLRVLGFVLIDLPSGAPVDRDRQTEFL